MTIQFSAGEEPSADLLVAVETLYRTTALELVSAVNAIKAGQYNQSSQAAQSVRDLRAALGWVMDERARVEKVRKQVAGSVGTTSLDMDAARDEVGRRLARLRDAAGG